MEFLARVMEPIGGFVWGPVMLMLLLGTGFYFSVGSGFLQLRKLGLIFQKTFGTLLKPAKQSQTGITPFQAMSTALASTMGTGNVVGVATALVAGGPGAIFWMWVSAFLGMMTKYAEVVLALHTRQRNDKGDYVGGTMYVIQNGLGKRFHWLAVLFCLFGIFASLGSGNMTQVNSMSGALMDAFSIPAEVTAILSIAAVALVIFGGIRKIAQVAEAVIPLLSVLYTAGALIVIGFHWEQVVPAFQSIFEGAFGLQAAGGGALGYTMALAVRIGLSRGVFSNEAGLGSSPIAHAAAEVKSPVEQGFWGAAEVFVDTLVVCTVTALAILTAGVYTGMASIDGAALTGASFAVVFGDWGRIMIAVSIVFFAYASMIGWSYYGEKCCEYLFCRKKTGWRSEFPRLLYKFFFLGAVWLGATGHITHVWVVADAFNGLMAIPNLIAVFAMSGIVFKLTKQYFRK